MKAPSALKARSTAQGPETAATQPMGEPLETELKLRLPPGAVAAVRRAASLGAVRSRTARFDAIYLDTPDRLLQNNGMALRLRREGDRWMQTLKLSAPVQGGLSARPEWEGPARIRRGEPRFDPSQLQETPLPALLVRHRAQRKLRAVFRTRFTRTLWQVEFRGSRIEVALDRGHIEAHRGDRAVRAPISELELELKAGRAADLLALAGRLVGRGAQALALVPLVRSKAERGYRLAEGAEPAVTKASARGFVEQLRADLSSAAALRAIVAHGLHVLLANTEELRVSRDPEFVHQARVSLRRMRSALRLFDRRHADFPAALSSELRWIGRSLGEARDADVFESSSLPALLADLPQGLRPQARGLRGRARRRRGQAHHAVLADLGSARFARLALSLQAWTLTPPPKGRSLQRFAPRALARAQARLFEAARFFAALTPERRHRVRILAKRLRYALDALSVTLPQEATGIYVSKLSELQDVLGELNDGAVALGMLDGLDASSDLVGWIRTNLDARNAAKLEEVEHRLLDLRQVALPQT